MIQRRQNNDEHVSMEEAVGDLPTKVPTKDDSKKLPWFTRFRKGAEARQQDTNTRIRTLIMFRGLMLFQATSELYVLCNHVIPYVYEDYSPMGIYYVKVAIWFCVLNMLANWACVILYDPSLPKTKDNPYVLQDQKFDTPPERFVSRLQDQSNGHSVYNIEINDELPSRYCEKCKRNAPYRTHHCDVCQTCIVKKDHHCYLVGNCIGFKNQRYFIMMMFYVAIVGLNGGRVTLQYFKATASPDFETWTDAVLPLTIWRSIFGNLKAWHCLLIFHLYIEFLFGFLACLYFILQMFLIAEGKTLYEAQKGLTLRISTSVNQNIKSVFGDFWALNFLFPMTLIFKPSDDGIHWTNIKLINKTKTNNNGKV